MHSTLTFLKALSLAGVDGKSRLAFHAKIEDHADQACALMAFGFGAYFGTKVVMIVVRDFRPVRTNLTEAVPPNILAGIHAWLRLISFSSPVGTGSSREGR